MRELMGAILAGGLSMRMGRDKATMRVRTSHGSKHMLEFVADALRDVCDDIAIVRAAKSEALADPIKSCGYSEVFDIRQQVGPLGGIEALLASGLAREYLVCPCDMPCITAEVLRLLLHHRQSPATVLRVAGRDQFEPLPARINAAALPAVRTLLESQERSIWRLMQELPAAIVEIDAGHAAALRNVNTLEDLNMA